MKIEYSKAYMLLFDLDNAMRTKRTYSEKDHNYVIDTEALKEPLDKLVKLVNEGEQK